MRIKSLTGFTTVFSMFASVGFLAAIEAGELNPSAEESPLGENSILSAFEIRGNIKDVTQDYSANALAKLESASQVIKDPTSTKAERDKAEQIAISMMIPCLVTNAVVKLVGPSVQQETVADLEGNFRFVGVSKGEYELSAEAPSCKAPGRKATGRVRYNFSPGRIGNWAEVEIHAFPVTVQGHVTYADGQPVVGAKVTGGPVCLSDDRKHSDPEWLPAGLERMRQYEISAITASDGSYKLERFIPPPIMPEIIGYLNVGTESLMDTAVPDSAFSRFYADIRVEANGYAQRTVPRVPLVTENLLGPARRFLHLMFQISDYPADREKLKGFKEKGEVLPSQGDTIPNIDIVLDPVIAADSASRENPTPPQPTVAPN